MKTDRNEFITQRASALLTTLVQGSEFKNPLSDMDITLLCGDAVRLATTLAEALEREGFQAWNDAEKKDAPPR